MCAVHDLFIKKQVSLWLESKHAEQDLLLFNLNAVSINKYLINYLYVVSLPGKANPSAFLSINVPL